MLGKTGENIAMQCSQFFFIVRGENNHFLLKLKGILIVAVFNCSLTPSSADV